MVKNQQIYIFVYVNVINRRTLIQYSLKYTDAKNALDTWYRVCKKAEWKNFNEVRSDYPSADVVGDNHVVFNVLHNKYRLIARFSFMYKVIQIKWFGTHADYNKIDVTKV